MKNLLKQIFKFIIVGGFAFIIDYAILYILTEYVGIHYLISSMISFSLSVVFNYVLSIIWVFDVQKRQSKKDILVFFVLSIIGLGINQFIMYVMVELMIMHYMFSKIFATGIVMVYNFITRKIFIETN